MKPINTMRSLLIISALFMLLTSCEEEDKTINNPAPDPENALMQLSTIYGGMRLHPDSVMTNNLGLDFHIDETVIVFSNFFFREDGDTSVFRGEPFLLTSSNPTNRIVRFPAGAYSGVYGLRMGLDSLASANVIVNGLPSDSELRDASVLRQDGLGIDHLIIRGRLLDPFSPPDSAAFIPLNYRVGLTEMSRTYSSLQKNFSIQGDNPVSLVIRLDLEPIFNDLDMFARPEVTTDPQNLVDFNLAREMADSLEVELF